MEKLKKNIQEGTWVQIQTDIKPSVDEPSKQRSKVHTTTGIPGNRFREPLFIPVNGTGPEGETGPLCWIVILGNPVYMDNKPDTPAQTSNSTTKQETPAKKPVVLVAEDTDSNYLLINALLRKDYTMHRAVDGMEAVELCRQLNPDIILMDIRMPRLNGLEATQEIRKFNKNIPIVALTAFAFDQDRIHAQDAGCNDFLTKPISSANLRTTLKKWLADE